MHAWPPSSHAICRGPEALLKASGNRRRELRCVATLHTRTAWSAPADTHASPSGVCSSPVTARSCARLPVATLARISCPPGAVALRRQVRPRSC